eukprot:4472423-Amphidinium_carterae.1
MLRPFMWGHLDLLPVQLTTLVHISCLKELPQCQLAKRGVGGVHELGNHVSVCLDCLPLDLLKAILAWLYSTRDD